MRYANLHFRLAKKNFFTFGEIYDSEDTIANFVGRNSRDTDGYGIDAALDFPLFYTLPEVIKGRQDVSNIRQVFINRKNEQEKLLSSNGEAGRFFVSFLDNHDLHERFNHPATPVTQVTAALCALFCLQGIPCIYYGTEQGLSGIKDDHGNSIQRKESVREALWGKEPSAFDTAHPLFRTSAH
jgi:glycosidase